ncbi:hypothetical protein CDAR_493611 [Caerostris darwini]|uniref:Uncharacterized protein n=1 Tax=Caerostris darwini TaxID=1538125 RepID=A0AAV4VU29_9ARAC|nr:hypothetical protein CDAR_493611 [Caerostris darwini]
MHAHYTVACMRALVRDQIFPLEEEDYSVIVTSSSLIFQSSTQNDGRQTLKHETMDDLPIDSVLRYSSNRHRNAIQQQNNESTKSTYSEIHSTQWSTQAVISESADRHFRERSNFFSLETKEYAIDLISYI